MNQHSKLDTIAQAISGTLLLLFGILGAYVTLNCESCNNVASIAVLMISIIITIVAVMIQCDAIDQLLKKE